MGRYKGNAYGLWTMHFSAKKRCSLQRRANEGDLHHGSRISRVEVTKWWHLLSVPRRRENYTSRLVFNLLEERSSQCAAIATSSVAKILGFSRSSKLAARRGAMVRLVRHRSLIVDQRRCALLSNCATVLLLQIPSVRLVFPRISKTSWRSRGKWQKLRIKEKTLLGGSESVGIEEEGWAWIGVTRYKKGQMTD